MTADEAEGARMSRTESLLPCGGVVGARPWRPAAVRRLTRLFRGAWGRIPKADRRIMVDYWDRPGYCFPLVILYDRLGTTADGKTTYAQYLAPGRFDFSHDMTADMPDEMVEALVGHELAHCWMYAVGDHPPTQYVESATDSLAECWGFPMTTLHLFCRHGGW